MSYSDRLEQIQIIVVDDEHIEADDMGALIQESFGESQQVVTRTAYNARTVLRMAEETPCDILITDIQMPGMDGLALAQQMRSLYKDITILFLTGYDDFSYAYEAFKYNAERYLLKTEGDEEIIRAVSEAIRHVHEKKQIMHELFDAEDRYNQMLPIYRRQLVSQLLTGGAVALVKQTAEILDGHLYVVVARTGETDTEPNMRTKLIAANAISQIIENAMGEALRWTTSDMIEDELVWVFSMEQSLSQAHLLFHLLRQARGHVESQLGLPLFFGVADKDVDWMHLTDKYSELRSTLSIDILEGSTGVAIFNPDAEHHRYTDEQVWHMSQLRHALEGCRKDLLNGNTDALAERAEPVLEYLRSVPRDSALFAAELTSTLKGCLLSYLNSNAMGHLAADGRRIRQRSEPDYLALLIRRIAEQAATQRQNAVKSIADYLRDYINNHPGDDLSAAALADLTGYSSGYLSRVFRQEFGVSIHDYVLESRMTLARELLLHTHLRVYEIARNVGYDDSNYFIKVFRGFTGMTPQEYKQSTAKNDSD